MSRIIMYTDGGCRGNQSYKNVGGYGITIEYNGRKKEFKGGKFNTTNNIMELTACIEGLKAIKKDRRKDIEVEINSDSNYVVQGMTKWIYGWIKKDWKTSTKKPVENKELWIELFKLSKEFIKVDFVKVKGHSGNLGNEVADRLVNEAMDELMMNKEMKNM